MRRSFRFRSWQVGGSAIVVAASALALVACASGAPTSSNAGDAPLAGDPVVSAAPHTSTPTAAPVTKPSTSAPTPSATSKKTPVKANSDAKTGCTVGAKLVPTCGVLWGAAAGGFSNTPARRGAATWEADERPNHRDLPHVPLRRPALPDRRPRSPMAHRPGQPAPAAAQLEGRRRHHMGQGRRRRRGRADRPRGRLPQDELHRPRSSWCCTTSRRTT